MDDARDIVIRNSASGRQVGLGPLKVTILLEAADGLGVSVALFEAGAGAVAPPQLHANTREDWCALICEGEMTVGTSRGERRAGPGEVIFVPRNAPFNWRNGGPGALRYFAFYMPAGFEQFFPDAAAAVEQAGGMPADPVDLGRLLMPLWRRYGVSQSS
jgi:mannose-6-phosphate isomerase-like protein (cupin superfamily)